MNTITINFVECDPRPSKGYKLLWRVAGSGDPYTDGGNFFAAPIVFSDNDNPDGSEYEGIIRSEFRNNVCNDIPWTSVEDSDSGSGESSGDTSSCGTLISVETTELTFVPLGFFDLFVDGASHVDLFYDVFDRPDRFALYDNGSIVASSGWRGVAPYPGPWGGSGLSTPTTGAISFDPIPGHTYQLYIEVGPAGPAPYDLTDNFNINVICS